jgi:hypothetical protein
MTGPRQPHRLTRGRLINVFKLGVYGFQCAPADTASPTFDLETLFSTSFEFSLLRYLREVTGGARKIEVVVHPWVNLGDAQQTLDDVEAVTYPAGPGPVRREPGAYAAIRLLNSRFPGSGPVYFDGAAIFSTLEPATGDPETPHAAGGETAVRLLSKILPTAYLNLAGPFSFYAHEILHVLGFGHSAGPAGVDGWGSYGDTSDIMSAMWFGNQNPTFNLPALGSGPAPGMIAPPFAHPLLWGGAKGGLGPGLSPAQLWRWEYSPDVRKRFNPVDVPWVRKLPAGAPPTYVRLRRAGQPVNNTPSNDPHSAVSLVAMPSNSSANPQWYTVEYRPAIQWDRAIPVPGIIIHTITREDGAPNDGPVDRVFNEGALALPGEGRLDWSNGRIAVTVLDVDPDAVAVLVGATPFTVHQAHISVSSAIAVETTRPGETVSLSHVGPRCGTAEFAMIWTSRSYTITASASYSGFRNPKLKFAINGTETHQWVSPSDGLSPTRSLAVAVDVREPVDRNTEAFSTKTITINYRTHGQNAIFDVPAGHGAYALTTAVNIAEDGPTPTSLAYSSEKSELVTLDYTLPPDAIVAQVACIAKMRDEMREKKTWPPKFDRENLLDAKILPAFIDRADPIELGPVFLAAAEIAGFQSSDVPSPFAVVAEHLDLEADDVARMADQLWTELDEQ